MRKIVGWELEVESDVGEMLKIVIFDSGWGGELVADFLMRELTTVEVVRVIDWAQAPYCGKNVEEICELVELNLCRFVGKVDLIVLGGYAVSLALEYMKNKYPKQRFIGMSVNYDMILRSRNFPGQVALLTDRLTSESELRQELRIALPYSTLIIPDCTGWEELINENLMTEEILRRDLGSDFVLTAPRHRHQTVVSNGLSFDDIATQVVVKKPEIFGKKEQALRAAIAKFSQASKAAVADEHRLAENLANEAIKVERRGSWQPDVILLLNTHFWEIKLELEAIFGYKVRVLDFREKLLHDVCAALKLRGVHGKRAK